MALRLITPPTVDPVTVGEVKAYARVDTSDDDSLIGNLIKQVTTELDAYQGTLNRAIITQTWELVLDRFPSSNLIEIPFGPVSSVTPPTVKYDDVDGIEQTFTTISYQVDYSGLKTRLVLHPDAGWPSLKDAVATVRVRFVAGNPLVAAGGEVAVPWDLKYEIIRLVAWRYDNRTGEPHPPAFWTGPISNYRRVEII